MWLRSAFISVIILVNVCYICYYVCHYVYNYSQLNDVRQSTASAPPTELVRVGRRPDDGVWFNFSVPPALLFFAYSAFVDVRTSPAAANRTPVVRVIAMSTKIEKQQQRNVQLYCVYNYGDGRPATVSKLSAEPHKIGNGYPLYSITVREYVYTCPLVYHDLWPISLSVSVDPQRRYFPWSATMPVEVPTRDGTERPLAVCMQVAYEWVDPVRLVEWFECQKLLGVSLIGAYLASDINPSSEKVLRYYADVDGLVDLRRSNYISRVPGGSATSPKQHSLHWSPCLNDCLYRLMFRFSRIAVLDFDEVLRPMCNVIPFVTPKSHCSIYNHVYSRLNSSNLVLIQRQRS